MGTRFKTRVCFECDDAALLPPERPVWCSETCRQKYADKLVAEFEAAVVWCSNHGQWANLREGVECSGCADADDPYP